MSNTGDEFGAGASGGPSRPVTGPEQWLGAPDPVESFGSTIEQALNRLNIELAGLRAERDGMRLELEGLRAQLQVTQQQLADRDRFSATVRELSQIVQQLSLPTRWSGEPAAQAAAAPQYPPPPAYPPPPQYAPPYVPPTPPPVEPVTFVPPPAEPAPVAYVPPPVVEPEPAPAPPAPAPEPAAQQPAPVIAEPPAPEPVAAAIPVPPVAPEPVAAPEPVVAAEPAVAAEPIVAPEPVVAAEPVVDAAPEPVDLAAAPFAAPAPPSQPSYSFTTSDLPRSTSVLATAEENFFSGPGVWIGEPQKGDDRRTALKTWATRVGSVLAALIVAMVFLVSIGPKFLPYQMFFVRSGSMSGTFETGDMILLTKANASDLKPQDIITFDRPDKPGTLVTHRIVSIETNEQGRQFVTKGDANDAPDPWRVPASGDGWKYMTKIPKLGFLFGYLGTPQARLALLAIPAVLLGILSLVDIWKPQPKTPGRR